MPSSVSSPRALGVVHTLRSGPFAAHPELSDTVLRSVASKATNTRRSILANYAVWKAWCRDRVRKPYPARPQDVAAFLQAQAPPIHVTKQGGFELRDLEITPTGGTPKKYATLARYLGTLDAAYAGTGRFAEAILTARRARELALAAGDQEIAAAAARRLALYEAGRPYREP